MKEENLVNLLNVLEINHGKNKGVYEKLQKNPESFDIASSIHVLTNVLFHTFNVDQDTREKTLTVCTASFSPEDKAYIYKHVINHSMEQWEKVPQTKESVMQKFAEYYEIATYCETQKSYTLIKAKEELLGNIQIGTVKEEAEKDIDELIQLHVKVIEEHSKVNNPSTSFKEANSLLLTSQPHIGNNINQIVTTLEKLAISQVTHHEVKVYLTKQLIDRQKEVLDKQVFVDDIIKITRAKRRDTNHETMEQQYGTLHELVQQIKFKDEEKNRLYKKFIKLQAKDHLPIAERLTANDVVGYLIDTYNQLSLSEKDKQVLVNDEKNRIKQPLSKEESYQVDQKIDIFLMVSEKKPQQKANIANFFKESHSLNEKQRIDFLTHLFNDTKAFTQEQKQQIVTTIFPELDELKHSEVIHQIDKKMYFMTTIARSRTTDESPEKNTSNVLKVLQDKFLLKQSDSPSTIHIMTYFSIVWHELSLPNSKKKAILLHEKDQLVQSLSEENQHKINDQLEVFMEISENYPNEGKIISDILKEPDRLHKTSAINYLADKFHQFPELNEKQKAVLVGLMADKIGSPTVSVEEIKKTVIAKMKHLSLTESKQLARFDQKRASGLEGADKQLPVNTNKTAKSHETQHEI